MNDLNKRHQMRRKKNHHNNGRRRAKKNHKSWNASSSGGDMDDIMAQLQLQRERQKQKKNDNLSDTSPAAEVQVDNRKSKKRETAQAIKQEIGDFCFDPISNRYLPKSSFNEPDRKEAQQQAKTVSIDRLRWGKRASITDEDVRRVLFHGSALLADHSCPLPNLHFLCHKNTKTKKQQGDNKTSNTQQSHPQQQIPCSDRTVQLLTTSLQYTNSHKRNTVVNLIGSIAMAKGATVVPSAVSDDMLTNTTKIRRLDQQSVTMGGRKPVAAAVAMNQKWHSLLCPMDHNLSDEYGSGSYPSSTFDVQAHPNSTPSVVTIVEGEELFCRKKYSIPKDGRISFQSDVPYNEERAWNLNVYIDAFDSVKFSPTADHVGIVGQDIYTFGYYFVFKNFNLNSARSVRLPLEGEITNFCFSSNDHNKCAFVRRRESEIGLSCLDISSGQEMLYPKHNTRTETLSVEFWGSHLLCGYRDGSFTLHDQRGKSKICTTVTSTFGSAFSMHPLQDGYSFLAKGSFGSCKVLDVRKFQNADCGFVDRASVMDLPVPSSLVHKTNSTRCSGVAFDPTETIVVSPFAGENNVSLALWSLKTGKFLRRVDLGTIGTKTNVPPFCELSSSTTDGFAISDGALITKESDFGVWFKSNSNPTGPSNCGCIHHLSFPKL